MSSAAPSDVVGEKRTEHPQRTAPEEDDRTAKKARLEEGEEATAGAWDKKEGSNNSGTQQQQNQQQQQLPLPQLSQLVSMPLVMPPAGDAAMMDMLVATLTEQVMPYLRQPNLELEIRLGRMMETGGGGGYRGGGGGRVSLPIKNPALLSQGCKHRLDASVDKGDFQKLRDLLTGMPGGASFQQQQQRPKFTVVDTITEDVFYGDGVRKSFLVDPATNTVPDQAQPICSIKKEKVLVLDITLPGLQYDLRMCLSKEVPSVSQSDKVQFKRRKYRSTFTPQTGSVVLPGTNGGFASASGPAVTQQAAMVEMTRVVEGNGKEGFEVEVETSMEAILQATTVSPPAMGTNGANGDVGFGGPQQQQAIQQQAHMARVTLMAQLIRSLLCDGVFLVSQCR